MLQARIIKIAQHRLITGHVHRQIVMRTFKGLRLLCVTIDALRSPHVRRHNTIG